MQSFHQKWQGVVAEQLESPRGFPGVLAYVKERGGRFANWHMMTMPASSVENDLDSAALIACGSWGHPYQHLFLSWANEAADRALADPRFNIEAQNSRNGWRNAGIYPGNHGLTLASTALVRAMRDDAAPDSTMLTQAADEIVQTYDRDTPASMWNETAQGPYLRAVQLLVVAGEVGKAKLLLKTRRTFRRTSDHHDWLRAFILSIPDGLTEHTADDVCAAQFQGRFDLLRDPSFRPPSGSDKAGGQLGQSLMTLRLELALIKWRYVLGQPILGHWRNIIGLIAE
jgi:hypothetical protein